MESKAKPWRTDGELGVVQIGEVKGSWQGMRPPDYAMGRGRTFSERRVWTKRKPVA